MTRHCSASARSDDSVNMQYQQAAIAFGGSYPVDPPSLEGMDQFFRANSKKARSESVEEGKETEQSKVK